MMKTYKKFLILFFVVLAGCAGNPAKVEHDPLPQYKSERDFRDQPNQVRIAAQRLLEEYIANGEQPTTGTVDVSKDQKTMKTDWVYGTSQDKYITVKINDIPERRSIKVRRKLSFHIEPAIFGSKVSAIVQEEVEKLDKNSGQFLGWQSVESKYHGKMLDQLQEAIRKL